MKVLPLRSPCKAVAWMRLRKISSISFTPLLARVKRNGSRSMNVVWQADCPPRTAVRAGFSLAVVLAHRDLLREQFRQIHGAARRAACGR